MRYLMRYFKIQFLAMGWWIIIFFTLTHCATVNHEVVANKAFFDRRYGDAIKEYKLLIKEKYDKKDKSYIIYLMNYALLNHYVGNWEEARKCFWTAYKIDEGNVSELTKAVEWLKAGEKRVYKLTKREKELLHFYLGLEYLFSSKYDEALIEFKKIHLLEEQKPKLPLVCFYMGKTYEIMKKYDDAIIEYRVLIELTAKDPYLPAYLELARVFYKKGEITKGDKAFQEFLKLANSTTINKRKLTSLDYEQLIIQIDQDEISALSECKIFIDGKYRGNAKLIDVFQPGITAEEYVRKFIKETASYAGRELVKKGISNLLGKLIPGGETLGEALTKEVLGEKADKRSWYYAPEGFSLFIDYIPKNCKTVTIEFYGTQKSFLFFTKKVKLGEFTFNLSHTPCVRIGDCIFLNVRFQSKPYGKLQA